MSAHPAKEPSTGERDPQTLISLLQSELSTTNHEVMLLTLELEQRVADRTTQLLLANQELREEISERQRAEEEIRKLNRDLVQRTGLLENVNMELETFNREVMHLTLDLENRAGLLQAANKELETFSYSVSHDLRAPLRHILGFATLLHEEAGPFLDEKPQEYLNKITESASMMSTLIDELLRFSRFSHAELKRVPVNFNAILEGVIRDHETEVQGRNIVWKRGTLPSAWGDPVLLRQVLVNLVSNALKYSRRSNPAKIEVDTLETGHSETVFFVRDNGVGFDPRYADKLFGVFQRLHQAGEFEGVGVGLATVRRIIARHGGKTWAEGEVGRGATFYFSLPGPQHDKANVIESTHPK